MNVDMNRSSGRLRALTKCAEGGWWQGVKDTLSNTGDALAAGQVPIPFLTVGDKFENKPITVGKGEPVYIGMSGADPGSTTDFADAVRSGGFWFPRKSYSDGNATNNNTQVFRWFDRAQARRAIEQYAKDHPVYAFGESYGGPAAVDAVRESGAPVEGVALYDPVGWGKVTAPTNVRQKVVNIQPKYNPLSIKHYGNMVATVGGRNPNIAGAKTEPWENFGRATHVDSVPAIKKYVGELARDPSTGVANKADEGKYMADLAKLFYPSAGRLQALSIYGH